HGGKPGRAICPCCLTDARVRGLAPDGFARRCRSGAERCVMWGNASECWWGISSIGTRLDSPSTTRAVRCATPTGEMPDPSRISPVTTLLEMARRACPSVSASDDGHHGNVPQVALGTWEVLLPSSINLLLPARGLLA